MDRKVEWGEGVFAFLDELLEGDLHGKRVLSLANATLGVMVSASLAVAVIGPSLAQARGLLTWHAIKQVDRLLSNRAIDPWEIVARWVPEVIGSSTDIQVVMDWTDFDADGQTTLALNKVTPHGRATPLLWLTVMKGDLKNKRNGYEDACLRKELWWKLSDGSLRKAAYRGGCPSLPEPLRRERYAMDENSNVVMTLID